MKEIPAFYIHVSFIKWSRNRVVKGGISENVNLVTGYLRVLYSTFYKAFREYEIEFDLKIDHLLVLWEIRCLFGSM
jgi:hypothetical protein